MPVPGEKSERFKRRQARMKKIAELTAIKRVRVVPTREELRSVLVHPSGVRLRKEGSTEWPLDQFTKRRLADKDITIETQASERKRERAPSHASASAHESPRAS
jgi:hypothetical protein